LNVIRVKLARLYQKCSGAQGRCVVLPHCSDSFEGEPVLWIQPDDIEVAQFSFVVVTRFKILVGLGQKACLLGFLGAGRDEGGCQNKRHDAE
jgi:hypothetical protein